MPESERDVPQPGDLMFRCGSHEGWIDLPPTGYSCRVSTGDEPFPPDIQRGGSTAEFMERWSRAPSDLEGALSAPTAEGAPSPRTGKPEGQ